MTTERKIGSVLSFQFYGDEKLDLADELRDEFHAVAKEAVRDGAQLLLREVDRLLTLRHGTPQTAAPEGEPPEQDTAGLVRSWDLVNPRVRGDMVQAGIKSNHPGAVRLEYGLTDARGIRTFPHPYIRPAMATTEGPIGELLAERLA